MNFKYYKTGSLITFILCFSVVFGALIRLYISPVIEDLPNTAKSVLDYLELFSVPGLLGLTLWYINTIGWKQKLFKWLVDIPDLNGRFEGTSKSSYQQDGKNLELPFVIEIKQSASSIHISSYYFNPDTNEITASYSVVDNIKKLESGSYRIYYVYTNQPERLNKTLNQHDGTASLVYYEDIKQLEGDYYNSRGNTGSFSAKYQSSKLLHRYQ